MLIDGICDMEGGYRFLGMFDSWVMLGTLGVVCGVVKGFLELCVRFCDDMMLGFSCFWWGALVWSTRYGLWYNGLTTAFE